LVGHNSEERRAILVNTNELKAVMKRNDDSQEKLAEALGLKISGVSDRIRGKTEFRRSEINLIRERYNLSAEETIAIFFDDSVSA
jgi:transcriptional regulator with XRE-family HTH domain